MPSLITLAGYAGAFYFLSMVLRSIPLGIAYAIWSGAGIVLVALVGWLVFKQHLDLPAIVGINGIKAVNPFSSIPQRCPRVAGFLHSQMLRGGQSEVRNEPNPPFLTDGSIACNRQVNPNR